MDHSLIERDKWMTQFEKTFQVMRKPWVIILYAILVVLAYEFADQYIAIYFHQFDLRTHDYGLHFLTAFGKWKIYAPLLLLLGLYFRYLNKNKQYEAKTWFLLACVLLTNIVGFVIKVTLSRARPDLFFDGGLFGFYWFKLNDLYWSFPSGHAITVGGLAAGLGVLFPKYFYAVLGLAFLVVVSRVILYFHFLSDVMTGFYLSILIVGIFTEYLKRKHYLKEIN